MPLFPTLAWQFLGGETCKIPETCGRRETHGKNASVFVVFFIYEFALMKFVM